MPENTTYNNECPICRQNYLTVVEDDQTIRGACQACGHQFSEWKQQTPEQPIQEPQPSQLSSAIVEPPRGGGGGFGGGGMFGSFFDMFNKIAGIIAIVAVVLVILISVTLSGGIGDVDNRVTTIKDSMDEKINGVKDDVSSLDTEVSDVKDDVNSITNDINNMKENDLPDIRDDITALKNDRTDMENDIDSIQENLTDVENALGTSIDPDVNVTFFYFTNQSNATSERYCHVKLTVEEENMHTIMYALNYNGTNITLSNWSGVNTKPETYQWTNDSMDDNYKVTWVEETDRVSCLFELKWNIDMYNTTSLPTSNTRHLLVIDGYYVDIPTIATIEGTL